MCEIFQYLFSFILLTSNFIENVCIIVKNIFDINIENVGFVLSRRMGNAYMIGPNCCNELLMA